MKLADISGGGAYLKAKIDQLETDCKIKHFRDISDIKNGYQPTTNILIVKVEKGDLIADSHSTLATWGNHFSQLLNVHGVSDIKQTDIHTTEPLVPLKLNWLLRS